MPIPIRNLYYLFCYAWERFPEGGVAEVGVDESPDLPNLFAKMLINGANRLLRRGLDRGYRSFVEETRAPRGKMLLDEIVKGQTLRRGAVVCSFDDLTVDVLHNQLIKATALQLSRTRGLQSAMAHELRILAQRMAGVSDIRAQPTLFRRVQLSRNTGQYRPLLKLCELVVRNQIPDQDGVGNHFADILSDEVTMSKLFEDFLRCFYQLEQSRFRSVGAETLKWSGHAMNEASRPHLPGMITDITLRSSERVVVMDAKFYKDVLVSGHGAAKVHSGNLYQMLAYLQHTALSASAPVDGILIYPCNGLSTRLHYRLLGRDVQVVTVDLSQPWQDIHDELLTLLSFDPAAAEAHTLVA